MHAIHTRQGNAEHGPWVLQDDSQPVNIGRVMHLCQRLCPTSPLQPKQKQKPQYFLPHNCVERGFKNWIRNKGGELK